MQVKLTFIVTSKLLFVDNRIEYFVSHRLELAKKARDAGYEVHVTALTFGDETQIREAGFQFHPISRRRRTGRVVDELALIYRLLKLYRLLQPGIVHHVTLRAILYGGVLARVLSLRAVVNSVTGLGHMFSSESRSMSVLRLFVGSSIGWGMKRPRVRAIFQNTDDQLLFLNRGWLQEEQAVLIRGSGVDPVAFPFSEPSSSSTRTVLFAARLLKYKGIEEFVEAAILLSTKFPDVVFAVAGDQDADNPAAVDDVSLARWKRESPVQFLGQCSDMASVLRGASIVCLPSYYREGVPKVLIEAASVGRPIVTSDMPGCREIVVDGLNGLLVPPRSAAALARALGILLADPERCGEMGRAGRDIVERGFSMSHVIDSTIAVYGSVLGIEPAATS
jgi:glycosyltransferase involved in cell wall biosynthesis